MQDNVSGSLSGVRRDLLGEAFAQLLDFVVGGTGRSGRIGVFGDSANKFTWIGLSHVEGGICAVTNDWFDIVPSEPSFHCTDRDPGVVFEAAHEYLCRQFATDANFRVQLHLGDEPVLHANTADDEPRLAPAPDFPSL